MLPAPVEHELPERCSFRLAGVTLHAASCQHVASTYITLFEEFKCNTKSAIAVSAVETAKFLWLHFRHCQAPATLEENRTGHAAVGKTLQRQCCHTDWRFAAMAVM